MLGCALRPQGPRTRVPLAFGLIKWRTLRRGFSMQSIHYAKYTTIQGSLGALTIWTNPTGLGNTKQQSNDGKVGAE